ncbi:TRAP transporter small permease [Ahrensia sp. R2A130]|uniref:TRAP transporter small permease n=1 Tax=Ahrensia sp. R2A130 TaxID=744979 RepID=UPI0001E0D12F|nr:TRAP transporter small permease [Ahrensia sp. R2A130]EFL87905.1 tripartite ATP-independent periplasmic transporter DctQ [Ahrensia sp. R2A130]
MPPKIRRALDALYTACGAIAAVAIMAIVAIILTQVAARYFGFAFRGGAQYAGYAMATASFFGFAYALQHGAHIRVSLLLSVLGRHRFWGEVWCYGFSMVVAIWFAYHACLFTWQTYKFKDVSQGLDATPLWIPQMAMAIGAVVFAIAFIDNFITLLLTGKSAINEGGLEEPAPAVADIHAKRGN